MAGNEIRQINTSAKCRPFCSFPACKLAHNLRIRAELIIEVMDWRTYFELFGETSPHCCNVEPEKGRRGKKEILLVRLTRL